MNGLSAVFVREITRLRRFLTVALLLTAMEVVVAFLSPATGFAETLALLSAFGSAALGFGAALVLGASLLAGDLHRGTASFDLGRPVSTAALFYGRAGAGLTLTFLGALLPLLPAFLLGDLTDWETLPDLFHPEDPGAILSLPALLALYATALVFAFLLGHAASTLVRERSAWLLLDLAAAFFLFGSSAALLYGFLVAGMEGLFRSGLLILSILLAVGLVAGSHAQAALGRLDAPKGRRVLSLILWGTLALGVGVVGGLNLWARHPSFAEAVGNPYPEASANGRYFTLESKVRGRGPNAAALFFGKRGDREPKILEWGMGGNYVRFSPDEKWALVIRLRLLPSPRFALGILPLDPPGALKEADLRFEDRWPLLLFSADSRRLLALTESEARILRFPSLDPEAAVRLPDAGERHWLFGGRFQKDGTLLLLSSSRSPLAEEGNRIHVWAWDPARRDFRRQASIGPGLPHAARLSPEGDRLLLRVDTPGGGFHLELHDTATGALLRSFAEEGEQRWASFFQDGRFVVVSERSGDQQEILLCDREGSVVQRISGEKGMRLLPLGEIAPGRMAFSAWFGKGRFEDRILALYDTGSNRLTLFKDLRPAYRFVLAVEERMAPAPPDRAAWRRLAFDPSGRLVFFDPETGRRTPLLAP